MSAVPYNLLQNRFNTYGKIAREDVYAAWVMMCADGSITKKKVHNLEFYFSLIHPTNMMPGVVDLAGDLVRQIQEEMGSADHVAVKAYPDEFFKGALLDPRLVGVFRQNEYYSSRDFYATTYNYIQFLSDGTFNTGSRMDVSATHRSSSGTWGGNTSGSSAASLRHDGTWETEGEILVLRRPLRAEERLHYRVDDRALLTWEHAGQKKLHVRVAG